MANVLTAKLSALRLSQRDPTFVGHDGGFVNAIKFVASAGSRAFRNFIRIVSTLPGGREKCFTERKQDAKNLPISAHELRVNHAILDDAYGASNGFGHVGNRNVYDNRAMMYTSVFIESRTIVLQPTDLRRAGRCLPDREVRVIFRSEDMGFLDLNDPKFFNITAATGQEDHELRSFYELLVVQGSLDSRECTAVGSEMYVSRSSNHQEMLSRGICFLQGFKKNARVVQENGKPVVKVVVDPVDSAFFAHQSLADSFYEVTRGDYGNHNAVEQFRTLYKNVRVCLSVSKYRILAVHGLSREKLEDIFFDKDGVQTRVVDYFAQVYGFNSRAGEMPALEVKLATGKYQHFPLDALVILKCQKLPMWKYNLVSPTLHDVVLKSNAVRAPQRFDKTTKCFSYVERSSAVFQSFGVFFSPCQTIHLGIRDKPKIATANAVVDANTKARFNIRGHKYNDPSECKKWMILNGSEEDITDGIGRLLSEARNRGLALASPDISSFDSSDLVKENWSQMFGQFLEFGYEFVLLIDTKKSQAHNMLKCCELIYGIQTQHIQLKTLLRSNCHENIIHKMNIKLYGFNYQVMLEPCSISQLFDDDKIFIIGYDVAHPSPSDNPRDPEPSVVGVSYNSCRQYQSFNGDYFYQSSKQEAVDPQLLKNEIMHGLQMRRTQRPNTCSSAPKLVFIFRDGLSEGQIPMAKLVELAAIKEAFEEHYGSESPLPPFVMVLATKRHNRRFYSSVHNNVTLGTVASDGIARVGANEFYMQSAYPIQGTSKLTNYEVITNEAHLTMDDIQSFTRGMCSTHQIVPSAVSIPEPVFVAHELAKRGRNNLLCYSNVADVPRNANGIDFVKLNKKLTYRRNDLVHRRFNA